MGFFDDDYRYGINGALNAANAAMHNNDKYFSYKYELGIDSASEKLLKAYKNFNKSYLGATAYFADASAIDRAMYFGIKHVIFNNPATIVLWGNGDKTVVKCGERDVYDPEKGLAMCIAKRAFGDKSYYYNVFKKFLPVEDPDEFELDSEEGEISNPFLEEEEAQ